MGRKKGSKNKTARAKARSAYETYSYWYDKYTKGVKATWFSPKYDIATFENQYNKARKAKLTNPARSVAASQEYVDRTFEKQYKKMYGMTMGDISNKQTRIDLFTNFVSEQIAAGLTMDEARNEFEKYFY